MRCQLGFNFIGWYPLAHTYDKRDGPVNKVKVKVFQLESLQRSLNGGTDILGTVVGVPELAGNKDIVARNLGLSESLTNLMFILICGSSKKIWRSVHLLQMWKLFH